MQGWSLSQEQEVHAGAQQVVGTGPGSALPGLMLGLPDLGTPSALSDLLNCMGHLGTPQASGPHRLRADSYCWVVVNCLLSSGLYNWQSEAVTHISARCGKQHETQDGTLFPCCLHVLTSWAP